MISLINHKVLLGSFSVVVVLSAIFWVSPEVAKGDYSYGYYGNPFGTPISGQYGYNRSSYVPPIQVPAPVIVPRPIYIPQPVYVQKPVYIQQPVYIPQPTYYPAPSYYPVLSVTCSANTTYANVYSPVTWTARASGGNGLYNYSWRGSDGLSGSGQSITYSYTSSGTKTALVTVYSGGHSVTRDCSNSVTIAIYTDSSYPYYQQSYQPAYQPVYQQPVYQQSVTYGIGDTSRLDIGCFVDPINSTVNSPVTWTAEVTGGIAPYTYSWTGSDGLSGSQSSIIKYYSSTGSKSAIVTITSADGKTGMRACSNAVNVASAYRAPIAQATKPAAVAQNVEPSPSPIPTPLPGNAASASFFSLTGAPWAFIAFLVILVLFFTVLYLLFEKKSAKE